MRTLCASICISFILLVLAQTPTTFAAEKQLYVVYMGGPPRGMIMDSIQRQIVDDTHYDILGAYVGGKEQAKDAITYTYNRYINGFAAKLDEQEAMELAKRPGIISVFPSKIKQLHTTHSWKFLKVDAPGGIWSKAKYGQDVIIGNLDTGVWPESDSFNDVGMGPVPAKWKGRCQNLTTVKCNKKLIGSKFFYKGILAAGGQIGPDELSPRDFEGHGTHTLSTAAGRMVNNASLFGQANGTAAGGAPGARVAAYKVCWRQGCSDADILAAFDAAIADGVDVLTVSVGGPASDYAGDGMAIGSFHAVRNGITVVCSAGNSGPEPGTVSNVAPWILTVGASTIDRSFPAILKLGNGKEYVGQAISRAMPQKFYPLIKASDAVLNDTFGQNPMLCQKGTLDPAKVKGKVVMCVRGGNSRTDKGGQVLEAGGVAMILVNDETSGNEVMADPHLLPTTHIGYNDSNEVLKYIDTSKAAATAYITTPTTLYGKPAPVMAAFSSRGPNTVTSEILKPDITGPGVNILAAYTGARSPTELPGDPRRVPFTVLSGTSMSCPHVAGIAGLIKSIHPDWSPSAIKSAIMTTADTKENTKEGIPDSKPGQADPFDFGAGHVHPNNAIDPGLVYDMQPRDYLNFLCKIGYNEKQVGTFSGKPYKCPPSNWGLINFNYPSITVPILNKTKVVTRTVKNVGTPGIYKAIVVSPHGVNATVHPQTLQFTKVGEEMTYKLRLTPVTATGKSPYAVGKIVWSDGVHHVRSPIVVNARNLT